eukprot:Hpha_TRINITY_DN15178_c4_g12::TRINITY_DN15178_c4_g12_i1::g.129779::m.129779
MLKISPSLLRPRNFTGINSGSSTVRRSGGGSKIEGPANPRLDLHAAGGVPIGYGNRKGRWDVQLWPNTYMKRTDMEWNVRNPAASHVAQAPQTGLIKGGLYGQLMWGVRWSHVAANKAVSDAAGTQRDQWTLVKKCPGCYFHSHAGYLFNYCTYTNAHWSRKALDQPVFEGYRLVQKRGGSTPARRTIYNMPIHRLGTQFPIAGTHKHQWGNPTQGLFDPWLALRRYHKVGRHQPAIKFDYIKYFFKEL